MQDQRRLLPPIAALLVFIAAWAAAAAPYKFTSADGGYTVSFPAAPQEQVNEDNNARTVLNALNYDNGYFAVVHVDNKFDLKLNDELEGNINKFTEQFNAPTQLRRKKKITRGPGDELPAEEFTFESEELIGKGIVIVEGRRTYMVAAFAIKPIKPTNRQVAVDRFINSFKLKTSAPGKDKAGKLAKDRANSDAATLAPKGQRP